MKCMCNIYYVCVYISMYKYVFYHIMVSTQNGFVEIQFCSMYVTLVVIHKNVRLSILCSM